MIELFPAQVQFVKDLKAALRLHRSVLAHGATGFGKTVVAAHIAKAGSDKGSRIVFCVHRRNLIRQTAATFNQFGIPFGYIAAGFPGSNELVQIASIETLRRRLDKLKPADLLYVDECHMACSRTWSEVIDWYRAGGARIIGNTATPARLDGRPLGQHFNVIVPGPSVRSLIDAGRLSDYRVYAPSTPDLGGVHTRHGDYVTSELEEVMDKKVVGDAAQHYQRLMPGRRAIAFCVSIKKSKETAEQFRAVGIAAAHIDGETPDGERLRVIKDFADGRINVLCNVELITTGFDLSAQVGREVPVEGGIMLRPTQSLTLWLQMFGRVLRRKPYPAIVTDHAGNALVHGLPDSDHEWSLDGREKKKAATPLGLRTCSSCFAVFSAFLAGCPQCGAAPPKQERAGPEQVDGELVELTPEQIARRKEEGRARGLEQLIRLGLERGYKKPASWAAMRHAIRANRGKVPDHAQRTIAIKEAEALLEKIRSLPPQERSA